jgi:hypothetical protein
MTSPTADPDCDGQINALEYACGSHPLRAEIPAKPIDGFIFHDSTSGLSHLAIHYHRRPAATDLEYHVQISEDLLTWRDDRNAPPLPTTVEISSTPAPDFLEAVTTRAATSLTDAPRTFLRLQVVLLP